MSKKKEKINVRELIDKYQENSARIREIADLCEKENRGRTETETAEYQALVNDNQLLSMRMQAAAAEHLVENPNARDDAEKLIRENVAAGKKTEIVFVREGDFAGMMVSDVNAGGVIPLNVQDILKPLQEGFILDKVGLPFPTGLVGEFLWPIHEMVEASIAGEGVALGDTKIPFSKLTASPERIGIAIPVTNQSLNQSNGILEMIIREIMPLSIRQLLNKILFTSTKVTGATNLVGPFAKIREVAAKRAAGTTLSSEEAKYAAVVALSQSPTFNQLNGSMKAAVLEKGIEGNHLCWVMTKSMKALLEGEPVNKKGVFFPIVQNDLLAGLPIYTSNCLRNAVVESYKSSVASGVVSWTKQDTVSSNPDYTASGYSAEAALATLDVSAANKIANITVITEYIGLGDWAYQPMGLFGSLRFIVDPYSQARKDSVDFVLNTDYATKTLRPEAFILGQAGLAAADVDTMSVSTDLSDVAATIATTLADIATSVEEINEKTVEPTP